MNKEKYLHKVIKYLSCSKKDKKRIYEDLSADIVISLCQVDTQNN